MAIANRPTIHGRHFVAASGHPLATQAGVKILESGGNAFDAGAAMGLASNVVLPDSCNVGGVAPILVHDQSTGEGWQISCLGHWPATSTIEWFKTRHGGRIPSGVPATVTPAALGAWVTVLDRFGSKTFADVVAPALELAGGGFTADVQLRAQGRRLVEQLGSGTYVSEIFGSSEESDDSPLVQEDLACTFERLIAVERAVGGDRHQGLEAVINEFYRGSIALEIAAFNQAVGGPLTAAELSDHRTRVESAISTTYRGHEVYACGSWCQGPVVLQTLNIMETTDVAAMGSSSAEYVHYLSQAINAAMADRHAYYGDPEFQTVPLDALIGKNRARAWSDLISDVAFSAMPDVSQLDRLISTAPPEPIDAPSPPDTTYLCVVDSAGNAMSATPSDGVIHDASPLIPGLGFAASDRGNQGWLDARHPAGVVPGKRPRLTPNPGLVLWSDGRVMPFGTPGGDVQTQAMSQVAINLIDFGMDPQVAIEMPRFWSENFPGSWDPHPYRPGRLVMEDRFDGTVRVNLADRGHDIQIVSAWNRLAGAVCICMGDVQNRVFSGGADPRRLSYAIGW